MKKIYFIAILALAITELRAQQDPHYTQYMYNMSVMNPAYAGSKENMSGGFLYRKQWVEIEGAPTTGTFFIHSPVGRNVGLGLSGSRKLEFYKFDPITNNWTQLQNINFNYHLYDGCSFVQNGKGYLATGNIYNPATGSGISTNAIFMYNPANDTWTPKNNFTGIARRYGIAFTIANNSFIGLGYSGAFLNDIWRYDDNEDSWTQVGNFTSGGLVDSSTFTLNDIAYIGNGRNSNFAVLNTFYKWDPSLSNTEFQNQTLNTIVEKDKIMFFSNQPFNNYNLTIYDLTGRITMSHMLKDNMNDIIVFHNLKQGIYILQLNNIINGKKISEKIIVP